MKVLIPLYQKIKQKVMFLCEKLALSVSGKHKGRKLAISKIEALGLAIFKQSKGIKTKKAIYRFVELDELPPGQWRR